MAGLVAVRVGHWPHLAGAEETLKRGFSAPIAMVADVIAGVNYMLANIENGELDIEEVRLLAERCGSACGISPDMEYHDAKSRLLEAMHYEYNRECICCVYMTLLEPYVAEIMRRGFNAYLVPSNSATCYAIVVELAPDTILVFDESPHDERLVMHAWTLVIRDVDPTYARMVVLSKWPIVRDAVEMCPLTREGLAELIAPIDAVAECNDPRCILARSMVELEPDVVIAKEIEPTEIHEMAQICTEMGATLTPASQQFITWYAQQTGG